MFTLGAMIASGENTPLALVGEFSSNIGNYYIVQTHPTDALDTFAYGGNKLFYYSGDTDVIAIKENTGSSASAIGAIYSYSNIGDTTAICSSYDGTQIYASNTDQQINGFTTTDNWTSWTFSGAQGWAPGGGIGIIAVRCTSTGSDVVAATTQGIFCSSLNLNHSMWPVKFLAKNFVSVDRVVYSTYGNDIVILKESNGSWSVEHVEGVVGVSSACISVNDDCSEIVWCDGVEVKSIVRSGTTWVESGLSIDVSSNTFQSAFMSPDGRTLAVNVADHLTTYSKQDGTWLIQSSTPFTDYYPSWVNGSDYTSILFSQDSANLILLGGGGGNTPLDVFIKVRTERIV